MNNTYFFNRTLADDVQAAELQMEYSKVLKKAKAKLAPIVNKKEVFAEAVWEKMYGARRSAYQAA